MSTLPLGSAAATAAALPAPLHTPRRRLEVVAAPAPRRRPRLLYGIIAVAGAVTIGAAQMGLSILTTQGSYEVAQLTREQRDLTYQKQILTDDVAGMNSPQFLAANASALGMVIAESPNYLRLSDGAVLGAVVRRQGRDVRIRARHGVVLGAGGFARNAEWREKYQGLEQEYSSAPDGDLGQAIDIVAGRGGALALMDDAWWGPTTVGPKGQVTFTLAERSMPFSLVVDAAGKRFLNESESYVDFGHHMLENNRRVPGTPAWLVFDARHGRRYLFNALLQGRRDWKKQGLLLQDASLAGLAQQMGVPPEALQATVERFNGFAKTGIDEDFHRGDTVYDTYYSDPRVKPNPNLGPLEKGPFSAVRLYPGDLGTKGGLVTDADARVLREDGSVIPGLYAAGNTTASVMGRTYPGAGATIAPAVVFGYRAARHAAAGTGAPDGQEPAARVEAAGPAEPLETAAG